ncbi:phage tail protein [Pasteurella multocida]|uniref:phage tail protein n=1 Tax=Pasteurella multocida TaxID=747 RepID=UPI00287A2DA0|nr:phage tail protein [Pasteurella multocida]HDX1086921.1 phage tail protein [Pasteurella multocida]
MSKITGERELRQAMQKLQRDVKKQAVKSIRKIAKSAMKGATKAVAKQIGVNAKTVRGRARLTVSPKVNAPRAVIRVNRSQMPLIRVLETNRNRISARKGVLKVGQHSVQRGFVQRLSNGRTHIMFRQGRKRYGIDVARIPLATPLTNAFHQALADYPEQLKQELSKNLSLSFRRT